MCIRADSSVGEELTELTRAMFQSRHCFSSLQRQEQDVVHMTTPSLSFSLIIKYFN